MTFDSRHTHTGSRRSTERAGASEHYRQRGGDGSSPDSAFQSACLRGRAVPAPCPLIGGVTGRKSLAPLLVLLSLSAVLGADPRAALVVPAAPNPLHLAVPVPTNLTLTVTRSWQLVEVGKTTEPVPATLVPAVSADGLGVPDEWRLCATITPDAAAQGRRRFELQSARRFPGGYQRTELGFRFDAISEQSIGLSEGGRPVLVYNHGMMSSPFAPAKFNRSTYIHPLYGLDGEVLSDDFPKDHYHHRGLFWAWPHVRVGTNHYDFWMISGAHQRFERWLDRRAGPGAAVLGVENGWYAGPKKIMQERVWMRVYPASAEGQMLDFEFTWIPLGQPLTLAGAEDKSYGGLTLRFAPRTETTITTPQGNGTNDLPMTRLPWADLSAQFAGPPQPSGAAIFIAPDHPDYPPTWLTRHYGVLCVGWPGVTAATFPANEPIHARYRVWIHRQTPDGAAFERVYQSYVAQDKVAWEIPRSPGDFGKGGGLK